MMRSRFLGLLLGTLLLGGGIASAGGAGAPATLPGTQPLSMEGDIASHLVDGVDRFLLRELDRSAERRERLWKPNGSSVDAYVRSLGMERRRLAFMLGVRDKRVTFEEPELVATPRRPAVVYHGSGYEALAVRWPVFAEVYGEGLLLQPVGKKPVADVVAIPDADITPEQLAGLVPGVAPESQYARRLAESGCRVLVPTLIDRKVEPRNGRARLTSREFLYRPAFELGRHLIGYEVQKVLSGVDWFAREAGEGADPRIGVIGWGEGGMLSLYAAALDTRIDVACVSGYFDDRRSLWQQPIDRNVFGLLERFGDAELAALVAPRSLVIEAARGPELTLAGQGGAPARLISPALEAVKKEFARAKRLVPPIEAKLPFTLVESGAGQGPYGSMTALHALLQGLLPGAELAPDGGLPTGVGPVVDPGVRQTRQIQEIDRYNQALLEESPRVRQSFMSRLDTSSPANFARTGDQYRNMFYGEVIGKFEEPVLPAKPRTRKSYDTPKWTGYEVVLDVFPDVIAYGVLLLPKDIKPGEKRPVVVCQHGLEGRPSDVITGDKPAYHDFAAKLAERGFITFAPQNLYLFGDRFRTLQRKANPLKKTLFSIITPQHQQIVDWLKAQPFVDPQRIAFYGLSYGGKTAMRVPALVKDYCLSICSADFNEWVWKNASTRSPYSYVWTGEYEIFEFDLGSTFNYAEMAALIAPRPFMVERGHLDGVAPDEKVAHEFAKVRNFYSVRLKMPDRCEIEWFNGPHTINGKGTFDFLHRHLNWP